jgi:hypothetical protein
VRLQAGTGGEEAFRQRVAALAMSFTHSAINLPVSAMSLPPLAMSLKVSP